MLDVGRAGIFSAGKKIWLEPSRAKTHFTNIQLGPSRARKIIALAKTSQIFFFL